MQDDFTVFWRNDEHAAALFYDLLARAERNAYDDDFLAQLAAYREAAPDSERADIFAARYLLHHGDAEAAVICGERAYAKRPVSLAVWKVLAAAYKGVVRELNAITMQGYIQGMYPDEEFSLTFPKRMQKELLNRFSLAVNNSCYMPLIADRAVLKNDQFYFEFDLFLGEEIPLSMPSGSNRFWVGLYVDEGFLSAMAPIFEHIRHNSLFIINNRDITFDIQKAREVIGKTHLDVAERQTAIVPIAGTQPYQNLNIQGASERYSGYLGQWAFSYFKFNESITLDSDENVPYAIGTPIFLGHSPTRKKLVLNILVDGLCWPATRALFKDHMPQIAKFFAGGVIFDQHFSTSEHTLPALPGIETGFYPHHTHIFIEKDSHELPPEIKTVSECMNALGYYCSAPLMSGHGGYHGTYRGYDRLIATYGFQPAYEGAERALRILEALPEADHFMFCHTTDVHPLNIQTPLKFSTEVEVNVPIEDRFVPLDPTVPSVRTPHLPIYLEQFRVSLHHVDRAVGQLLSYIETHYNEDEYIVSLYSDHGCALFDSATTLTSCDFVGEYGTASAWMMRGAGVPKGIVTNELTSSVDIYPTLAHLCGFPISPDIDGKLPAVFGGTERDVVYSSSQYPGQTFKLAVRTRDHVLRLETRGVVDEDGSVDFTGASVGIYPRGHELDENYRLDDEPLRSFFYPRARNFVHEIANNGERFPMSLSSDVEN